MKYIIIIQLALIALLILIIKYPITPKPTKITIKYKKHHCEHLLDPGWDE